MSSSKQIVSVFGSVADVTERLRSPKFSGVTVHSALEIILSGAVGLEMDEGSHESLARDMCFLSVAAEVPEDAVSALLSEASLDRAPLSVRLAETPDVSQPSEDPLEALGAEMSMGALSEGLVRLQDTVGRVKEFTTMLPESTGPGQNPNLATILDTDSPLGRMMPEDSASGFVFCQLAVIADSDNGPPQVVHDPEAPVLISGIIRKFSVDEEDQSLMSEPEGDNLFVSDRSLSYVIESGTPSIITIMTPRTESSVQVRTWYVYNDSIDGMSPEVARESMKTVEKEISSSEGITVDYAWPSDQALVPLHVSPPVFSQEDAVHVARLFMSEVDDDD